MPEHVRAKATCGVTGDPKDHDEQAGVDAGGVDRFRHEKQVRLDQDEHPQDDAAHGNAHDGDDVARERQGAARCSAQRPCTHVRDRLVDPCHDEEDPHHNDSSPKDWQIDVLRATIAACTEDDGEECHECILPGDADEAGKDCRLDTDHAEAPGAGGAGDGGCGAHWLFSWMR